MGQKGSHTWTIIQDFHRCPDCGYINESRDEYTYRLGKHVKEVRCDRCGCSFQVEKFRRPKFGPLWDQEWRMFG